jgi:hypothetical protein
MIAAKSRVIPWFLMLWNMSFLRCFAVLGGRRATTMSASEGDAIGQTLSRTLIFLTVEPVELGQSGSKFHHASPTP